MKLLNNKFRTAVIYFCLFFISIFLYAGFQLFIFLLSILFFLGLGIHETEKVFGHPASLRVEIPNKSISDARNKIVMLLKKTEKEIIIVSGTLNHEIYENEEVLKVFMRLADRIREKSINFSIYITCPNIDCKSKNFIKLLSTMNIFVKKIVFKKMLINHFLIVDNHVRFEQSHLPNEQERRAIIRYDSPYLVLKTKNLLNDVLENSNIENINLESEYKIA